MEAVLEARAAVAEVPARRATATTAARAVLVLARITTTMAKTMVRVETALAGIMTDIQMVEKAATQDTATLTRKVMRTRTSPRRMNMEALVVIWKMATPALMGQQRWVSARKMSSLLLLLRWLPPWLALHSWL